MFLVVAARGDAGLGEEARVVVGAELGQELDRDEAAQPQVAREVDGPHAAVADLAIGHDRGGLQPRARDIVVGVARVSVVRHPRSGPRIREAGMWRRMTGSFGTEVGLCLVSSNPISSWTRSPASTPYCRRRSQRPESTPSRLR
jgi:hypothetical protein